MEYRIPNYNKIPDMFNSLTGDVYEVEPTYLINNPKHGVPQATGYVQLLHQARSMGLLPTNLFPNDWNIVNYHLGNGGDWPGKLRTPYPGFPGINIVADYVSPGLVVYWYEINAFGYLLLSTMPWYLRIPNIQNLKKPNYRPTRANQPAFSFVMNLDCSKVLLWVGYGLVIFSVVTSLIPGINLADAFVFAPAGLMLVYLSSREVYVPKGVKLDKIPDTND
jgi:hypothetical protein